MNQDFTIVILEALKAVRYSGETDNARLRAAIQDLSNDYPQEKKLFMRNADDQFLRICFNPAVQDDSQEIVCKSKASQYIQKQITSQKGRFF